MSFKLADVLKVTPDRLLVEDRCPLDKKVYHSKREAKDAARRINRGERTGLSVLRCSFGAHYHLGHRRGAIW